ncbi:uncharacterized protein [Elaeis guineensis]|uniref:uncharacterized protein n=1 Tax=Elaeis guineensis var. tenera TaxID=51953 RepID=UPI003C6D94B6
MRGDQHLAHRYFQISAQSDESKGPLTADKLDQQEEEERGEPAEQLVPIAIAGNPDRKFSWPDECRQAFEELKRYLASLPLLVRPEVGEVLYLYLATSPEAVSSVLVRENENRVHQPIYYVSKVLHEAETRYSKAEKMIFALVISAQRLRPYFQAHAIMVLTDQPLRAILHRPDTSGRLAKWAMRLSEFDIQYRPRPALKAQVLADFIAECPTTDLRSGEGSPTEVGTPDWSGAGFLLTNSKGVVTDHALRFDFKASNNQAEYEALVAGLKLALELGVGRLKVFSNSQLIVGQIKDEFETRDPTMAKYHQKVKDLMAPFEYFEISHIPRAENAQADALSRLATSDYGALGRTFVESLERPSIDEVEKVLQLMAELSWMDPIAQYLTDRSTPEDSTEARRLRWTASQYMMIDGRLYKRSFSFPLLKCLGPTNADYALREFKLRSLEFRPFDCGSALTKECEPPTSQHGLNVLLRAVGLTADGASNV